MMRKIFSLFLSGVFCLSAVCSAAATVFSPSVERKAAPVVVELKDAEGNAAVAKLKGAELGDGTFVSAESLVVTSVMDAENSDRIPDASQKALLEVYNGLQDGSIKVPFKKLDKKKAHKLVVRDLFDISWTETEDDSFEKLLDEEGVSLEMTFVVNIASDAAVYVMVYKNEAWQQIRQVTNNGDGTITCVFDHLCPVAVIVEDTTETEAAETAAQDPEADDRSNLLWVGLLAVSSAALAVLVRSRKRKQK